MSKVIGVKEVGEFLKNRQSRRAKKTLFYEQIKNLKKGEGFEVLKVEYKMKTKLSSYLYQRINKKGEMKVSVYNTETGYLIVKQ
jgi:hypothetical protein